MKLSEFADKVDLDTLHQRLFSEMSIDAEFTVESDFENEFFVRSEDL